MARILIIDDELAIAMVLKELLSDEGYEIIVASNGVTGLQILETEPPPEIILMDLLMPGMGGREIVNVIRAKPDLAKIPIILLTGAMPNISDFPPEGSYQDIINKPFEIEDVISKINFLSQSSLV
jgi:CheY-like chemotaxis protein